MAVTILSKEVKGVANTVGMLIWRAATGRPVAESGPARAVQIDAQRGKITPG